MTRTPSSALRAAAVIAALAPFALAVAQDRPAAAQETPAAAPATAPEPAAPAPAAQPRPAGPTLTTYGFLLLSSFFDSGAFNAKDNANIVKTPTTADHGGAFVASARGTRVGLRVENVDSGIIRAKLSGVAEFDFKGGHYAPTPNSTTWNAFIPRLRLGFIRAEWKTGAGVVHAVAGQDWGLLLNLNPNTVTYSCDPVFVGSGNLYRRGPQARVGWDLKQASYGLSAALAASSPADTDTQGLTGLSAVDTGVGNKSRQPDVEGRVGITLDAGGGISAMLGAGYHVGKRRYFFTSGASSVTKDVQVSLLGLEADLNLTKFLQVKGEFYDNEGVEDGYTGNFPGVFPTQTAAPGALPAVFEAVTSQGWWAQATLKPFPFLWLAGGYGTSEATRSKVSATAAGTRYASQQVHGAIIVQASKALRLAVEAARTETRYVVEGAWDATQLSFASQLSF
jgi:hypothetical protein